MNGVNVSGPLAIPNTGGWQNWVTLSKSGIALPAGPQTLRVVLDANGPAGVFGNMNYLRLSSASAASAPEVVIYASDVPAAAMHGVWSAAPSAGSPNGTALVTPDNGVANTTSALASPVDYVDVTFNARQRRRTHLAASARRREQQVQRRGVGAVFQRDRERTVGLRGRHHVWTAREPCHRLTASSLNGWGWQNGAYWLAQATTVTFAGGGAHTLRIQVREDGVQLDQIVLSPQKFRTSAPGTVANDLTIVPKP